MSLIKDKYKAMLNERGIQWEEGKHTEELILNADEVIKSPGIPNDAPIILKLKIKVLPSFRRLNLQADIPMPK